MKEDKKAKGQIFAVIIAVQFACVALLIAGVLALKFALPKKYKKVVNFFCTYMCEDTNAQELLNLAENED